MTASELPEERAEQRAAGTGTPSVPAVPEETAGTVAQPDSRPAPPDDPERLKEEIERTREQLGETVEQLAAKVDVKSRAQDKVAELTGRFKSTTARAREQATARVSRVRGQVQQATPEPVRRAVGKGTATTGPGGVPPTATVPAAVAAAVLVVGLVVMWQVKKR